jgi:Na+/H+ antiporter NhaD/arsenite permease-like protein
LATGAVLANVLGTTGASMLLIRPWIRMNKYRFTHFHAVFFIFVVSNVGGCLTPIGDPPLFLGYLKGVPFFWVTEHCWSAWLLAVICLLAVFAVFDQRNFLRAPREVREAETAVEKFRVQGLANFGWLALILVAVFVKNPPGLREALMVAASVGSLLTTAKPVREANHFSFGPIKEVAWLFLGIFASMVPALDYLELHAASLGLSTPLHFYWSSGALSGVLDNAHRRRRPERRLARRPRRSRWLLGNRRRLHLRGLDRRGLFRRHDLHRQRPELHGQSHLRQRESPHPHVLHLRHPLFHPHPPPHPRPRGVVGVSAVI